MVWQKEKGKVFIFKKSKSHLKIFRFMIYILRIFIHNSVFLISEMMESLLPFHFWKFWQNSVSILSYASFFCILWPRWIFRYAFHSHFNLFQLCCLSFHLSLGWSEIPECFETKRNTQGSLVSSETKIWLKSLLFVKCFMFSRIKCGWLIQ